MDDYYYADAGKIILERRPGWFTVGFSSATALEAMKEHFSAAGYHPKEFGLSDRLLVGGPAGATADLLREGLSYEDVPFITPAYVKDNAVMLLEDMVRVATDPLTPEELAQFEADYGLVLDRKVGDGYQFRVRDADGSRTLAAAARLHEEKGLSATPRFKRVAAYPDDLFDFEGFFS